MPAGAAVLIQNFVRADITTVAPCLTNIGGVDAKIYADAKRAPYIGIDTAKAIVTADEVNLLNETVSLKAFQGDRLTVTDGMRIQNGCDYPLTVTLKAEAQFGDGDSALAGSWADLDARVFLGKINAGAAKTDYTVAEEWDATPIHVSPSATGVLANATTGSIVVPAGEDRQIGFLIDAGVKADAAAATLRFTVTAAG